MEKGSSPQSRDLTYLPSRLIIQPVPPVPPNVDLTVFTPSLWFMVTREIAVLSHAVWPHYSWQTSLEGGPQGGGRRGG